LEPPSPALSSAYTDNDLTFRTYYDTAYVPIPASLFLLSSGVVLSVLLHGYMDLTTKGTERLAPFMWRVAGMAYKNWSQFVM